MSAESEEEFDAADESTSIAPQTLLSLNRMGDLAHVAVAALLVVMTALVLVYATVVYARQVPLMVSVLHQRPALATSGARPPDQFIFSSIEFLSNILFAVILLEILHTTLIFLQHRSSQAVLRAFLVVAILSIVRKILLVEAEASLTGEEGVPFIESASGILVCIVGILLLAAGLIYTRRNRTSPGE